MLAEVQVSGLDAVVNYTSLAEICLQPALVAARQGSLNDLAAASESQTKSIQQLVALWNVDVMGEGMQGVVCPCYVMPVDDIANELIVKAQVSGIPAPSLFSIHASDVLMCVATCMQQLNFWAFDDIVDCTINSCT